MEYQMNSRNLVLNTIIERKVDVKMGKYVRRKAFTKETLSEIIYEACKEYQAALEEIDDNTI